MQYQPNISLLLKRAVTAAPPTAPMTLAILETATVSPCRRNVRYVTQPTTMPKQIAPAISTFIAPPSLNTWFADLQTSTASNSVRRTKKRSASATQDLIPGRPVPESFGSLRFDHLYTCHRMNLHPLRVVRVTNIRPHNPDMRPDSRNLDCALVGSTRGLCVRLAHLKFTYNFEYQITALIVHVPWI